jgi:hypothetical protein
MDQQHIVSRSRNAILFSVRQPLHTDNIVFLSERKRLQPLGYHLLYLLCVFLPLPFSRIFDFFVIHGQAYQKSCIVGRPTSYIILPSPNSEFIPLEAHTVQSYLKYIFSSQACLILFVAAAVLLLLPNLAFEHGVCAMGYFSTAGRSDGVLGARERSLGWCGILCF